MDDICVKIVPGALTDLWWVFVQEITRACRMLVHLEPLLGIYSDLVRYYLALSLGVHRTTGKLLSVLASIFTELAQKVSAQ